MMVRTVLVGLGGYGNGYVDAALDGAEQMGVEVVGAVDPAPHGCRRLDELVNRVGTVHRDLASFYAEHEADLAVISAPIHYHAPFTIAALRAGSHVLCEKPAAATEIDARAMADAAAETGRSVTIGYQWSFAATVQRIREEVGAGRFGDPLSLRVLAFWPRQASYYARSDWAGKLHAPDGRPVMDSPANNATAHYLHNALFILGPQAGAPVTVQAELYRANAIESFDTAAIRVHTACGAEVLFFTTHAVPSNVGPLVWYRFANAELTCDYPGHFYARYADGSVVDYGSADVTPAEKLARVAADVRASAETGAPVESACSIVEASLQLRVVGAAHASSPITAFPPALIRRTVMDRATGDELTWAEGVQAVFTQCFARGLLPSEHGGVDWARAGSVIRPA